MANKKTSTKKGVQSFAEFFQDRSVVLAVLTLVLVALLFSLLEFGAAIR